MKWHKLLLRQLKRANLDVDAPVKDVEAWHQFLKYINNTYVEEDQARYLSDRSMQIITWEMNELNNKLNYLQQIGHIGYWYNNLTTGVNIWSKELYNMYGLRPGGIVPNLEKIFELIHPEDKPLIQSCFDAALANKKEFEIEIRCSRFDNRTTYKWYSVIGRAEFSENNSDKVIIGIAMDIDLRKKNQEKLAALQGYIIQSEQMATMGLLSAGIAHEINNPLTFTLNNLGTLNKRLIIISDVMSLYQKLMNEIETLQIESLKKFINDIDSMNNEKKIYSLMHDSHNLIAESVDGLLRIKKIVANIKNFSTLENTELEPVKINDCINSALDIVSHELKYDCEVIKNLSELPIILASQNKLMLVFVNLLLNAKQACTDNGKIIITTKSSKSNIIITISDNGCGIAPENIPKIFTPFFTTKATRAESGLGLASVYGIIQSHKGKISVDSKLGLGTTFTIEFPLQAEELL